MPRKTRDGTESNRVGGSGDGNKPADGEIPIATPVKETPLPYVPLTPKKSRTDSPVREEVQQSRKEMMASLRDQLELLEQMEIEEEAAAAAGMPVAPVLAPETVAAVAPAPSEDAPVTLVQAFAGDKKETQPVEFFTDKNLRVRASSDYYSPERPRTAAYNRAKETSMQLDAVQHVGILAAIISGAVCVGCVAAAFIARFSKKN